MRASNLGLSLQVDKTTKEAVLKEHLSEIEAKERANFTLYAQKTRQAEAKHVELSEQIKELEKDKDFKTKEVLNTTKILESINSDIEKAKSKKELLEKTVVDLGNSSEIKLDELSSLNKAILQLEADKLVVENSILGLKNEVKNLESTILGKNAQIKELEAQIKELNTSISSLKNEITTLQDFKVSFENGISQLKEDKEHIKIELEALDKLKIQKNTDLLELENKISLSKKNLSDTENKQIKILNELSKKEKGLNLERKILDEEKQNTKIFRTAVEDKYQKLISFKNKVLEILAIISSKHVDPELTNIMTQIRKL